MPFEVARESVETWLAIPLDLSPESPEGISFNGYFKGAFPLADKTVRRSLQPPTHDACAEVARQGSRHLPSTEEASSSSR